MRENSAYDKILDLKDSRIDMQAETKKAMKKMSEAGKMNDSEAHHAAMKEWHEIQDRDEKVQREILRLEKIHDQQLIGAGRAAEKKFGKSPYYSGLDDSRVNGTEDSTFIFADLARACKYGRDAANLPDQVRDITTANGQTMIQDPLIIDEIIYSLKAGNELAMAGAKFEQLDENYRTYPKVTAYPSHQWQENEGDQISLDTSLTIGSVKWELKTVACRVSISQQALMDSSARGRRIIQESIKRQLQGALAQACFTGTGATGQPEGIENFTDVQVQDAGTAAITDWSEIINASIKLASVNVPISNISAFYSPKVWGQLASMQATDNQPLLKPSLLEPVRFFNPTNYIPQTYDTDTTSRIFLGDFSKLVVGIQGPITLVTEHLRADRLMVDFIAFMRIDVKALLEDNFCYIDNIDIT